MFAIVDSACRPGVALAIGGVLAYVFYHLLKAPTALGAHTIDQIDGFKLFLETAEKDRLEMLNPPNVTPQLFESFLPYAIALDCENQWSKKFEAASRGGRHRRGPELRLHAALVFGQFLLAASARPVSPSSIGSSHRQRRGVGVDRARFELRQRRRRIFRRRRRRWRRRRLVATSAPWTRPSECGRAS